MRNALSAAGANQFELIEVTPTSPPVVCSVSGARVRGAYIAGWKFRTPDIVSQVRDALPGAHGGTASASAAAAAPPHPQQNGASFGPHSLANNTSGPFGRNNNPGNGGSRVRVSAARRPPSPPNAEEETWAQDDDPVMADNVALPAFNVRVPLPTADEDAWD